MSFQRSAVTALLFLLIISAATAQSSDDVSSPALFFIHDKPVRSSEFVYLYRKNHQSSPNEFTKEKIDEYFNLFVNYKLKVEEALSRGMDTTAAFRKEYKTYHDELLKPYLPAARVVDSLVALTYDRLKEEVDASHILVALKPDASPQDTLAAFRKIMSLRERALAGEDFGDLAAAYSDEPGAKTSRGNLGFFTAMQMVFPFEQAAYSTPVGQISPPVRTQYGYHILKVLDRQPARGEVEVSHIMIRTGDGIDDQKAKNTIFDIYEKLQKGVAWEELCRQYSEDPNTKDKGGRLRPFGVGAMNSAPEFQEMAFALKEKGDISDPFQTQYGWHILRLESKIPLPPLEQMRASLIQRVSRDERVTISRQALRERLNKEFTYSENGTVKSQLMSLADSSLFNGKWHPANDATSKQAVLFTMQNEPFRVTDFLSFVNGQSHRSSKTPAELLDELFINYVDAVQIELLEKRVMRDSPDYKWLLKEYYEGILLFEIMEKEVWNRAMEDSVGQRSYFNSHADKYAAGDRIAGKIFIASSNEKLQELKALLESKAATEDFLSKNGIKVQEGPFEKGDRSFLADIDWRPGTHLGSSGGTHYLVLIEKILPPGPKTFDEARASVISDYQSYLEEAWIKELKAKFGVKIKKKAKKQVFRELTSHKTNHG